MTLIPRANFFDVDKFFDDFFTPVRSGETVATSFAPRVDIKELDDYYELTAELPGVKKDDVQITLEDGILSVEAETNKEETEEENGRIVRQERRYGKYRRSFNLGGSVREEDISASFEDGILKLSAPKTKEETSVQRRIEIQ